MSWLRIDDTVPGHRKMLNAGPAACWMWVCGIAYCQQHLTDGFIPDEALSLLGVKDVRRARRLCAVLVQVGLFERAEMDRGWRVHDYHDHNATSEEAYAQRVKIAAKRAQSGQIGGIRSAISRRERVEATKQTASNALKQNEAPSHPIPIRSPLPPEGESVAVTEDALLTAAATLLVQDAVSERAREFIDQYPAIYATARNGASYRVKEARDFPAVVDLVTQWPDLDYLTKMLRLFLLRKDFAPKNEPGSPRQFAWMAPQCDAMLRESQRRHG